ncbi:hypothetical protein [Flavilitoribacter nigricans]|uniref:Uncharacterized protein n=1 Tax=Flavilitoribacter nigricans (strain ATCC 23147 / DSM 23189 / NBRC 102662 / NCIMB 1420 / SS-2) TaxID=1122177 RepID=A0A2D0N049_FLAN2|nr:hypothetical protein [Flavilitoribacter nigricans]PHN01922.1 hypothetical protein CRP01_34590 [Flavilitoribacter nigricans DSM 23189 = NBRC 102662]
MKINKACLHRKGREAAKFYNGFFRENLLMQIFRSFATLTVKNAKFSGFAIGKSTKKLGVFASRGEIQSFLVFGF